MGFPWLALIMAGAGIAILGAACHAEVLLFPNGARPPGELGGLGAGAWSALASGAEANYYNPAGLAAEPGTLVTVGADAFRYGEAVVAGESAQRIDAAPGYLALAWGPSPRGGGLPVGAGIFAQWPLARELRVTDSGGDTMDPSALPDAIDPGGLVPLTGEIRRDFTRSGSGSLRVLATGFALGAELASGWRVGAGLVFERVQFAEQSASLTTYRAENESAPHETYAASVQAESRYAGLADRLVPTTGLQIRVAPGITIGLFARWPSRNLGGEGSVFLSQTSRATFQSDDNPGATLDELIVAEEDGLSFQLRTPKEVTYAIGLASSRIAFELDVTHSYGLPTYTAIAVPESEPPSTAAYRAPDLRTGTRPVTRWAAGMTYAVGGTAAMAFGVRDDSSEVPGDDAVFRSVNLYTVTTGVVLHQGLLTASLGLAYQFAQRQSVSFPSPLGDSRASRPVEFQELAIRFGASWVL